MAANEKQAIFFPLTTHSYNSVPRQICYGLCLNIPKCSDVIFSRKYGLEKSVQGNKGQAERGRAQSYLQLPSLLKATPQEHSSQD